MRTTYESNLQIQGINLIDIDSYLKKYPDQKKHESELRARLKRPLRKCLNCQNDEWILGGCDMCFTCTTGEADASDDYEITP